MVAKQQKSGIVIGLNKGHKVTPRESRPKPSRKKGVCNRYNRQVLENYIYLKF